MELNLNNAGFKYKYFCNPKPEFHIFEIHNLKQNTMKITRAKFNLSVTKHEDGSMSVSGGVVTSGCEENKSFSTHTPSGSFSMIISKDTPAQENFTEGNGDYYLDITKCEAAPLSDENATS